MEVTSAASSGTMSREQVTLSPSRTRRPAWTRFSGVIKLRVPSSSSGPQRPQLLRAVIQPSTSSSVGIDLAISSPPSLAGPGKSNVPLLVQRVLSCSRRKMTSVGGGALLGRQPAINNQLAAGDKGGLIGSEVQHPIGHVLRLAEPPEGVAGHTLLASLLTRQHPGRHWGLDDSRMDGVTPDAFPGVLHGRRLGKKPHLPLRSAVGSGVSSNDPCDGGDVDNRASPGLAHRGYGVFSAQEHPLGIHLHHPVPLLRGEVLNGNRLSVRTTGTADARIVHQHVQRAKARHGSRHGLLPLLGFRHIQRDEEAGAAAGVDLGLDLLAFLFQEIPNDHLGTLTGKEPGFCSPLAPGAAANERNLAFESHGRYHLPYGYLMRRV